MAQALPFITTAMTAYSALKGSDTPKVPKVRDLGDPDSVSKKRKGQAEEQRRNNSGRANTVLTGSNTLG